MASLPGRGVPPVDPDPVYAQQCGACHLAFPASLAPAATWNGILADLKHHFGADATLSADQVGQIKGWLDANSAEHWDTLQLVGDPKNSAAWVAPNIPRANANGMF